MEFKPDLLSDKQRKRRSSRTGGLSSKDPWQNILLFRTAPEERYNINDWHLTMKPRLTPGTPEESPLSPMSPTFSTFTNPFASRDTRSPSSSRNRPDFQHKTSLQNMSTHPYSPRERPSVLISPSPSLRSRRSDVSSQASSQHPPLAFTPSHPQTYTSVLPSDLPSPASTSGYDTQFIEGWTSAQGRSSALSSHTRGSNSIASAVGPTVVIASTPPATRETILDRAFQMRCIPGSERLSGKDEEHITSIARFEALMQEVDERKQQKCAGRNSVEANDSWDLDDEFEKASSEVAEEEGRDDDDDKDVNGLEIPDQEIVIPTPAQRALEYISGRQAPLLSKRRTRPPSPNPLSPTVPSVNPQAVSAFHGDELHPSKGITNPPPRPSRPAYLALPSRSVSTPTIPSHQDNTSSSTSTSSFRPGTTNELGGTNGKGKEDQISGS